MLFIYTHFIKSRFTHCGYPGVNILSPLNVYHFTLLVEVLFHLGKWAKSRFVLNLTMSRFPFTFYRNLTKFIFSNGRDAISDPEGHNEVASHDMVYRHPKLNWLYFRLTLGKRHSCLTQLSSRSFVPFMRTNMFIGADINR